MKSRDIIKIIEADGWVHVRTQGSHKTFKKPGVPFLVTLPDPKKETKIGLIRDIEKKTGLKLR